MSNSQIKALESYQRLMNTNASSHVLRASVRLGIMDALREGQKTLEQITQACGLDTEPTELLLQAILQTGLIEKYGDDYALAQVAALIPGALDDFGDRYWKHLEEWVKTGKPVYENDKSPLDETDFLSQVAATEWITTPAAMEAVKVLEIGKTPRMLNIIELGGGSTVFAMTIAHIDPTSSVTVVDDGLGLKRAQQTAESIGVLDRLEMIESDYRIFQPEQKKFDLAILVNLLHKNSSSVIEGMLKNVQQALKEDGQIAVLDIFPGQEQGTTSRAFFQLELALRYPHGRLADPQQMAELMEKVGFTKPKYAHLAVPPHIYGMLVAEPV